MSTVKRAAPLPVLFAKAVVTSRFGGTKLPADGGRLTLESVAVDTGRLDDYQKVCGFRVSDAVPSTFLHVLAFPLATEIMAARTFPLPLVGLVHVENRIEQLRPVFRGEAVTLDVHAADLRPHRVGRQVDLVTEVKVGEEVVMRESSTYLRREKTSGSATDSRAVAASPEPVAAPVAEVQWRLPADTGRRYAGVSGDVNPIHLSNLSAKALGFPRAIAHGMYVAARTISALEYRLPSSYVHEVSFKKPVLLPATVRFAARPVDTGWDLAVDDVRKGTPHLTGCLRQL
ncbi:MaoC family dehydratase [Jatrophihabitans sp. YIM 134969]